MSTQVDCRIVILNGASASGKSRLIAGIQRIGRETGVLRGVRVPQRATTRGARENESLVSENRYLTKLEFDDKVRAGELDIHWHRPPPHSPVLR